MWLVSHGHSAVGTQKKHEGSKGEEGEGAQLSNVWNGDNLENRHTALDSADS